MSFPSDLIWRRAPCPYCSFAHAGEQVSRDFRGRQIAHVKGSQEKLEVSRTFNHLFNQMLARRRSLRSFARRDAADRSHAIKARAAWAFQNPLRQSQPLQEQLPARIAVQRSQDHVRP